MGLKAPDREACLEMDRWDPLAPFRDRFELDPGLVYMDGNSLGAPPRTARAALLEVVDQGWSRGLVRSWNEAGWTDAPTRLGDLVGDLLGAAPGQVVVADSTSINLFKLLVAALEARPQRRLVLTEEGNFPTDLYVAEGAARLCPGVAVARVPAGRLEGRLDDSVAVLALSHVDYRLGSMHDAEALTRAAHEVGALVLWDLSHSVGAMPLHLDRWDVDLAAGCTYKYLNGGPGSPAFLYVAGRLQAQLRSPVPGWFGHADPFTFQPSYEPAPGVSRWLAGTPPILACAALEGALEAWRDVDLAAVREKSIRLGEVMIRLADERLGPLGVKVASPREAARRGSQVCLAHPEGGAVMRALIEGGVVADFRPPDVMRFGMPALYTRFVDVYDAAAGVEEVLRAGRQREARFRPRPHVP
ncbi:MAG: kynureninase [Candidatus Dormibacterales bacterium]